MHSNFKDSLLIVDERYDFLNLIEVILESEFEINIIKASSNSEALTHLKTRDDIKAILSRPSPFHKSESENEDNHYLYNLNNSKIPFISYCSELSSEDIYQLKENQNTSTHIENLLDEKALYSSLEKLTNIKGQNLSIESEKGKNTLLKRIKLSTLRIFSKLSYDLYLKISDEKFIQVAKQGNDDLNSIIDHYKAKGIDHLYLKEFDYTRYLETAKEIIMASTEDQRNKRDQKVTTVQIFDFAFQISREQLSTIGVTRIQEEIVHSAMANLIEEIKEDKKLFSMVKDFFDTKNYMSEHSLLIIYLSSMILKKMGWSNEQTLTQVIYAGFFHDIFIPEDLARVQDINLLTTQTHKDKVLQHISNAAKLLESIKGLNNDAHRMIKEHHEKPDGTGFPHGLKANQLPPLSCVFITAHYIVDYLYDNEFETKNLTTFIQDMQDVWDQGNFKRVYNCTRSLLLD